ncbi:MAG TPA: organomercurial lyase [Thermoplasmata archaeon]|nr:organomercurial lyase [Thermoplasmata archaeon]
MVVGASPTPTCYIATVAGIPVFVRCGADLLLTGASLDLSAHARCPVCGGDIRFEVRRGKVENLEPTGSLLYVVEEPGASDRVCVRCEGTHVFDGRACLDAWRAAWERAGTGPKGSAWAPQAFLDRVRALGP